MAALVVRNIPEATHRALKQRARDKGVSTEAEIRAILEEAVNAPGRLKLGSALFKIGRRLDGADLDIRRDNSPGKYAKFG